MLSEPHRFSIYTKALSHALAANDNEAVWHWVMLSVVLATIPAFYLELAATDASLRLLGSWFYLLVFVAFTARLAWLLRPVDRRRPVLKSHWLDILIAVGAAGNLAGSYGAWSALEWVLRLLFVVLVLARILKSLRHLFSPTGTIYLLGLGAAMLALSGAGFYWLEPTVNSYADGLWLAFVSGATVGYGDLVPTTTAARIFAAFIVLLGYALMSLVTASIAAAFIGEDEKLLRREMHQDIRRLYDEVAALREELRTSGTCNKDKSSAEH
jgi:voltage-gated potassium channel